MSPLGGSPTSQTRASQLGPRLRGGGSSSKNETAEEVEQPADAHPSLPNATAARTRTVRNSIFFSYGAPTIIRFT